MVKDLLFGPNGYCNDVDDEAKRGALDIINNTTLSTLDEIMKPKKKKEDK